MNLTKEQKLKLTTLHDTYVKYFNELINELKVLSEDPELGPDNRDFLFGKLAAHINAIGDNAKEMDALIDQLGFWHRTYNTNPNITKKVANQGISNN